jgi:DNA-binding MarR family transcriptional regulator
MAEARWLDTEEQRTWQAWLAAARLLDEALDRQLQREAGMPHAYYGILATLSSAPDRTMRMSDLASGSNASQSRLSHAVNRMEAAGWVRRERCEADKRVVYAVLTGHGMQVLRAAAPGHVAAVREHLFDQLTPEQVHQLGEICQAMLTGLTGCEPPATAI